MSFRSYEEAAGWITGLVPFGIKPGLLRIQTIMEKLDHPERRLSFIHIAGTNGKGSTCAYITSVLRQCGYEVGTFNSPYITRYTDRIQMNGQDIPDETVVEIANQLKPIADELANSELGSPTMFEITTALAIVYFARYTYPDFVVWETGLGGKEDCTNVVTPILSVITNVGHDHMDILGETLEQVAAQKAGIIKSGVPVVCAADQPSVRQIIQDEATRKQSTLYLLDRDYRSELLSVHAEGTVFSFEGPFRRYAELEVSLLGAHQRQNGALAVMALEVLRQYYAVLVDEEDMAAGLKAACWPGRLEQLSDHPQLIIDGAHNPEGAKSLADALHTLYPGKPIHFMLGMLSTKNHSAYLWHILPIVNTLIISEPDFRKKMDASKLAELVEQLRAERAKPDLELIVEPDWKKAIGLLRRMTGEHDLAVVSGTLYMISDVRSWLLNQTISEKGW